MQNYREFGIDVDGDSGEVAATCPQCSHTRKKKNHKCLSVNLDKQAWKCNHCGWTGGLKSKRAYEPKQKAPEYIRPLFSVIEKLPENVLSWFSSRGISERTLTENKISFESGWILFPFIRLNQVINIKYRNGKKEFRQVKGAEKILFGLDHIDPEYTVIVEGEMDKLALYEAGIHSVVSVPDGAPSPETKNYSSKFDFLESCKSQLEPVKKFIIAVDRDEPGKVLESELARRLGYGRCYRVEWPDTSKDANDVLLKHGAEFLRDCIDEAEPFPMEGIYYGATLDLEKLYRDGHKPGYSPGWNEVERFYTISRESGELNIVTGIPGHGKSEFIDAIMVNLAESEGWSFGVFSPENYPLETHGSKLIEKYIGLPFREGFKLRMQLDEMQAGKQWLHEHFYFLLPPEDSVTVDSILEYAAALVYRHGIRGLVIDPWNELDHARDFNYSETEYISQALTKFRRFARNHECHVWLLAHPTKLPKADNGKYNCPTPYDISGSAHWRNKADNCIAVYRDVVTDDPECPVEIHIQKVRKKHQGRVGVAKLKYRYSTGVYYE